MIQAGRGAAREREMLQYAAEGGGRGGRSSWERAFRALSLGPGIRDCGWRLPQEQRLQRRNNGGVTIRDRRSPVRSRWAPVQPGRHAPARARPGGCSPARQSAEAAAAAPRGVTAPSQWLRWRRARDCIAGRRRAAREGRPSPPPAALVFHEGSLGLRPGVDGGIQVAASGGKGRARCGAAQPEWGGWTRACEPDDAGAPCGEERRGLEAGLEV